MLIRKKEMFCKAYKYVGIFILTSMVIHSTVAQQPLSLENAIRLGLEKNYQVLISRQQTRMAQNNNSWGMAGRYPVLSLGVNQGNRYDDLPAQAGTEGRLKSYTHSLNPYMSLNWNLFDGFAVNISKDKFGLLEQYSAGNTAVIIENTIQAIILAYYNVLLQEEKLKVLETLVSLSRDRYNYTITKKEIGSAVTYDVLQSKDAYLSDSSNYLLQKLNVKNAWLNFRLLLGVNESIHYNLTEAFRFDMIDYDLGDMMQKMLSGNKTLQNQYVNQEILKKDIQNQQSDLYPSLGINAGVNQYNLMMKHENTQASYANNFDYYANFSLSFNLSNGGRVKKAIQNARIEEIIGNLSIAEMKQSLANTLLNFYELYNIRKQVYNVAELSIESAQLNLEISDEKLKSGAINSFNYRDVQLVYLNAALGKLEAIYNLIDTRTELLRLTGGIVSEY